jgi:hypothetical protein
MTRRYGRAKCGHRLVAAVPHGHWKATTFVGALRCDGLTAPFAIDGAMFRDSSDGRSPTQADGRLNWPKVGLARA